MKRADQRKYHYIYKITRIDDSGRYYIGMHSTDDLDDNYFGSGSLLSRSIKKHGKDKQEKVILEFLPSREALKLREKELVNEELLGDKRCMNLRLGGDGGWHHINNLPPSQRKNLKSLKNKISSGELAVGGTRNWTAETWQKCSDRFRQNNIDGLTSGWKHTDEAKGKIGKSQGGGQVFVCLKTGQRLRSKSRPDGWASVAEINEDKKKSSVRWFNDGTKNYLIDPINKKEEMVRGRL